MGKSKGRGKVLNRFHSITSDDVSPRAAVDGDYGDAISRRRGIGTDRPACGTVLKSDKTLRALQIHGGAYDILLSILIDVRKLHIMTSGIAVNGAAWPWLGYVSTPVLRVLIPDYPLIHRGNNPRIGVAGVLERLGSFVKTPVGRNGRFSERSMKAIRRSVEIRICSRPCFCGHSSVPMDFAGQFSRDSLTYGG